MTWPGFDILYEQGPCLVVNKPGGVLTQAPPEIDSLERRIKAYLKQRDALPGGVYLGMPHRLDRPVSGAVVVARHARAAKRLSRQFEARRVEKLYWALVEGSIEPNTGTLQDYVRKIPDRAHVELVEQSHPEGRHAILHFRVLARSHDRTWIEIQLETGRMHQIRVQLASLGHPVLGDQQYGSTQAFGDQTADPRHRWIALHGRVLRFRHPMTQEAVEVVAPLPEAWKRDSENLTI